MKQLRIVPGGKRFDDGAMLDRLAATGKSASVWTVPKDSEPGDDVIVHLVGVGLYATALIGSSTWYRTNWPGRYGAQLRKVRLIEPPISIAIVREAIPALAWARYPKSLHSPKSEKVADQLRDLVRLRRRGEHLPKSNRELEEANLYELRAVALRKARSHAPVREHKRQERIRADSVALYVLTRANGKCESCQKRAPFIRPDGSPYLEPHHTTRLADDGPDHPAHVIAICPNCHRHAHIASDSKIFNRKLIARARQLDREFAPQGKRGR